VRFAHVNDTGIFTNPPFIGMVNFTCPIRMSPLVASLQTPTRKTQSLLLESAWFLMSQDYWKRRHDVKPGNYRA
jgi:hypothetical protein